MHLDVVTPLDRLAPLRLHAIGQLRLVLAQIGVLAELGEDRQARLLRVAGVEQGVRRREHVRLPVDLPSRGDRLPGLVVERQRGHAPARAGDQHQVLALEQLLVLDHELALDERAHLGRCQVLPGAWTVRGDERDPAGVQVLGDPAQRGPLAGLVDVVEDVAEDDRIEARAVGLGAPQRLDRPLLKRDERVALGALGDRVGAQLDAVQPLEVRAQACEHRPETAADVQHACPSARAQAD